MKFFSRWLVFGVTVLTIAWLTSIAFATGAGTLPEPTFAPGAAIPIHMAGKFKPARPENGQAAAAAAATAKPQMSETVFKNIQVLKGIPVDEFMGTMGVFTTSLSLCCGNCHTGAGTSNPKWEDDPPRKRTARAMISMVQDINKTRFG
ncbi:MAG TPA: photosynthetic reaction center cytochrome c subunit family protein, partial [Vicinamibacterales bacterium]|nr:photosynthetic reaction center cytochrome c subunit family protein [Vicinamibacterales bacterium]